jgi:integrase
MALTDVQIRKAAPVDKDYKLSDSGGLYLMVKTTGGKLWQMSYRYGAKSKTLSFGKYPLISLAEVREKAFEAKKLLTNGIDPGALKKANKQAVLANHANSFESVATQWFKHWSQRINPRHSEYVWTRLKADVFPEIGHLPIEEIQAPILVRMIKKIEVRGAMDIAKRNYNTCGQIFRYAIAHGLATRNPVTDVHASDFMAPRQTTNFARIDSKDLPDLLTKIDAYQGSSLTRLSMSLMALTFLRTSELIGAKWSEIDFDNALWRVPGSRMKVKTRGEHLVPLSTQAVQVLKALKVVSGHKALIFPGERDPSKPMSNNTILGGLKRMGYQGRMTGHGFRGLASTSLHEANFNHFHVEVQLAHTEENEVAAAYNHAKYLAQRTLMMQWWGDYLDKARAGVTYPYPPLPKGYVPTN